EAGGESQAAAALAQPGEAILVVDDNRDVRLAVCTQLASLGYNVHEADSGHAALERLETLRVDLLFTDMIMPGGLSGKDVADRARTKISRPNGLFPTGVPGQH